MHTLCDIGAMPDVRGRDRAGVSREVVIGAMNPKAGCAGSILNLFTMKQFNHQVQTTYGVCEAECSQILKQFFAGLRKRLHETDGRGICNRK